MACMWTPIFAYAGDVGGMTAASVAQLVKSVNFIILMLIVPSLFSAVRQQ